MKRKLMNIIVLSTIAFSSSYIFADNLDLEKSQQIVKREIAENNLSAEELKRQAEYEKLMKQLEIEIGGTSSTNNTNINEDENIIDTDKVSTDSVSSGSSEIVLTLNSKIALINGYTTTLTSPPVTLNGRTFLPLRFIVDEVLNCNMTWNEQTNTVTVIKDGKKISITIGNKVAYVDGNPVNLDAPALIKNGTTMLPLRFISETFGITTDYNKDTKKITLVYKDGKPNTPPNAYFYFGTTTYTEGQNVGIIEASTDDNQDKIVAHEWQVTGDLYASGSSIKSIFSKPKAGNYTVKLRVKDGRGLWSDWFERNITIEPNKAPQITSLEAAKKSYAQGEEINLTYTYENEKWESITSEKWTYRQAGESESKAVIGKPKVMFTEGEYIISLELTDAYGNRSEKCETTISITNQVLKTELGYHFTKNNPGDLIDNYNSINYRDYEDAFVTEKTNVLGTMILSDSPEEVKRDGVLYRDVINGNGRILLHHLNGYDSYNYTGDNRRLVLIAQNTAGYPVTLTVSNKAIKGPSTDVCRVGQLVLSEYLKGTKAEVYTLKPGERIYVYDSKASKWTNGQCISGLMDIATTGDVTFTVASVKHGVPLEEMVGMELLTQDVHPRGTFDTTQINYKVVLNTENPTKLLIGTGTEDWVTGYDAITRDIVQNRGNFGITYKITLTATVDTGIMLNPRGSNFRGAIKWDGDSKKVYNVPGNGEIIGTATKAVVLGVIKAGETRTLEYMLPNGSSAPVLLGFVPKSNW